jgi:hypothetical protein
MDEPAPSQHPTLTLDFDPESKTLFALIGRSSVGAPLDEAAVLSCTCRVNA